MPRYIDADAFEADCHKRYCTGCENYNGIKCKSCWVDDMLGEVEDAPTISPDEVRGVGEWEDAKRNGIKRVLDPCCGSKMMWFDSNNPDVEFCDIREVDNELIWTSKDGKDKRYLTVSPDTICDVRHLPFEDNSFYHIVFDPPHLQKIGDTDWLCKKYGKLDENWESFIHDAFVELMRVLKPNGTLIFKWSEIDITVKQILAVIPYKPLYGHRSGKHMTTHWMAFIKDCPNCGAKMKGTDDGTTDN